MSNVSPPQQLSDMTPEPRKEWIVQTDEKELWFLVRREVVPSDWVGKEAWEEIEQMRRVNVLAPLWTIRSGHLTPRSWQRWASRLLNPRLNAPRLLRKSELRRTGLGGQGGKQVSH